MVNQSGAQSKGLKSSILGLRMVNQSGAQSKGLKSSILGLRMVNQSGAQTKGLKSHLLTFLLIMIKSLVLPLVTREIVSQVGSKCSSFSLSCVIKTLVLSTGYYHGH